MVLSIELSGSIWLESIAIVTVKRVETEVKGCHRLTWQEELYLYAVHHPLISCQIALLI